MIESPILSLKGLIVGVVLPFLNEIVALFIASAGSSQRLRRSQTIPGLSITPSTFPLHG